MRLARHHRFTFAEYLRYERDSEQKHEWLDGNILAMAGGSIEHARLVTEVSFLLRRLIGSGPCRLYSSDLLVRVRASGLATYPDVTMICGRPEADPDDANVVVNPTLIVEVLSPSTESYDRGEKWSHYRRIPTLAAYILVDQFKPCIEMFERTNTDTFEHRIAEAGQALAIACLNGALSVDDLYRDRG